MNIKNYQRLLDDDFDAVEIEKIMSSEKGWREDDASKKKTSHTSFNADFRCSQCKAAVNAGRADCSVNNRNHCPHCLWSLHVDLNKAGDRLSSCHSRMQPIGLTMKQTLKRYDSGKSGELMLIHLCTACGKLSINRIAADDNPQKIFNLFRESFAMDETLKNRLAASGIRLLGSGDTSAVYAQLFGWQGIVDGFVEKVCCEKMIMIDETIKIN